jgi:ribosomal protein S18 acetylase RimI-like enzyme
MLQIKKLSEDEKEIEFLKDLYEQSFPIEERRDFAKLKDIYQNDLLELNLIKLNNQSVGLLNYWHFNTILYIEHLAVSPQYRNQNIASTILAQLNEKYPLIILEVELPTDEISRRRIRFYQRNGFSIQPYKYFQPAYRKGEKELKMHIMSNAKNTIKEHEYQEIIQVIRKKVYEKFW